MNNIFLLSIDLSFCVLRSRSSWRTVTTLWLIRICQIFACTWTRFCRNWTWGWRWRWCYTSSVGCQRCIRRTMSTWSCTEIISSKWSKTNKNAMKGAFGFLTVERVFLRLIVGLIVGLFLGRIRLHHQHHSNCQWDYSNSNYSDHY